jgi:hypothetical protein
MWKRPEEITAHNQSQGRGETYDPAQWLHTLVVEVETLWLEGDTVVLAGCCESVRLRRDDVIAWRELPGRDGHPSTYQVRLRQGAEGIAQRAVKVTLDQPRCPRCGRSYDGLPAARGRDENSPDEARSRDRGRDDGCGGHDHGHDENACHGHDEHHGHAHGHGHHGHGHHAHHGHDGHAHHAHGHGGYGHGHGPGEHEHGHGGGGHHYWHHAEGAPHHHHGGGDEHHHHD